MARHQGPDRRGGDAHYQSPIVDLVVETDPTLTAAVVELQELGQLLTASVSLRSQLLARARDLAITIEELQAQGNCPPALHKASLELLFALGISEVQNSAPPLHMFMYTSPSVDLEKNINITSPPPEKPAFCTKAEVVSYLQDLGFDNPDQVIATHGLARVKEIIRYACSQPSGKVQNLGAYIRGVLSKSVPPGPRRQDPDRYVKGRYGHVVKR